MWSRHNCLVIGTSSAIGYDVISKKQTELVGHGFDVWRSSFLSSFMDALCRVINKIVYVLSRRTVSALIRALFWSLVLSVLRNSGNKHQNNPLVSAETVRHPSTYTILNTIQLTKLPFDIWNLDITSRHYFWTRVYTRPIQIQYYRWRRMNL